MFPLVLATLLVRMGRFICLALCTASTAARLSFRRFVEGQQPVSTDTYKRLTLLLMQILKQAARNWQTSSLLKVCDAVRTLQSHLRSGAKAILDAIPKHDNLKPPSS